MQPTQGDQKGFGGLTSFYLSTQVFSLSDNLFKNLLGWKVIHHLLSFLFISIKITL